MIVIATEGSDDHETPDAGLGDDPVNSQYDNLRRLTKASTMLNGQEVKSENTYDPQKGYLTSTTHNTDGTDVISIVDYSIRERHGLNPLFMEKWRNIYSKDTKSGLYLHFDKNVHSYVREWLIIYSKWLRKELGFPVKLDVYCMKGARIACYDNSTAYGRIILPDERIRYPWIELACGDFDINDTISPGIQNETDLIMITFTHEIVHYYQYINGFNINQSRSVEWQASYWAKRIFHYFDSLYDDEE